MKILQAFILVLLASFFPYMPILHASEDSVGTHCAGVHEHDETDEDDHSMDSCIEIIKKIHRVSLFDLDSFEPITFALSFESYYLRDTLPISDLYPSHFHATGPPETEAPNQIGIVRIIS